MQGAQPSLRYSNDEHMRGLIILLLLIVFYLQYALWLGKGGLFYVSELEQSVLSSESQLELLKLENSVLAADVHDLKGGEEAIEERARNEMGMIKKGEKFIRIIGKLDRPTAVHFGEVGKN